MPIFCLDKNSTEDEWLQVKNCFSELYKYIEEKEGGLMMPLSNNGVQQWLDAVKIAIRHTGILAVWKDENNKITGMGFASIRLSPNYLGSIKTGSVNHFFVFPDNRKNDVGKKLLNTIEHWLHKQNVHSIEIEVTVNNTIGQNFWKKSGYYPELIKMRKLC